MMDRLRVAVADAGASAPAGSPVPAGTAYFTVRRGLLSTSFRYDDSYLASAGAYPIDPGWPLLDGGHHAAGLPGAFRDCSPDRWGRNLILRRLRAEALADGRSSAAANELDYLLGVSDFSRQGALRFSLDDAGPYLSAAPDVPPLVELPRLLWAADAVARGEGELAAVKELLDAGSGSLGGARPKASVMDAGALHLAKFPHPSDEWDVMAWENTALDLADAAAITTPRRRFLTVDGKGVLLLQRFDRRGSARIGYISAMTVLGAEDGEPQDYLDLAEAITEISPAPTADLRELWRRIAFSVAIHNTDDHLRNHGFLREGSGWVLSPMFDVNPSPIPGPRVTSIAGGRTMPEEIDGLISAAPHFRLTGEAVHREVRRIAAALSGWRHAAQANGIRGREAETFAPIIDERVRTLLAAVS